MLRFLRSLTFTTWLGVAALLGPAASASAQTVLRVTAIPDEAPTELARKAAPLMKYLEGKLGTKVEFTPVTDYAAAVEALVNKKVDLAWFGGFTFVQAHVRSGGKVLPLVQREEDEKFRSVFITGDPAIQSLADLKGKDLSFGSQSSTSGHLMPRSFLLQAGALNMSVWDKFVAEKKVDLTQLRVFYTTPPYYDYNWTVHADMPAPL
jgi:phosphonate transport system substrate-binding protein